MGVNDKVGLCKMTGCTEPAAGMVGIELTDTSTVKWAEEMRHQEVPMCLGHLKSIGGIG